jgi:hypothetical protein
MIRPVGYGVIGALGTSANSSHERASRQTQTVPYGTCHLLNPVLAVNCQATVIRPSGAKARTPVHIFEASPSHPRCQIEDEDDDEYENEGKPYHAESRGLSASKDETKKSRNTRSLAGTKWRDG